MGEGRLSPLDQQRPLLHQGREGQGQIQYWDTVNTWFGSLTKRIKLKTHEFLLYLFLYKRYQHHTDLQRDLKSKTINYP